MLTKLEIALIASEICRILQDNGQCEDIFLSVKEAADFLGFSPSYIYHNLDKIPHIKKNNIIRFSKKALTDYINNN